MEKENKLALIDASELSLVPNNFLNKAQLEMLLKRTPQQYVKQRPAKGGGKWDYVTGGYVRKVLNIMFGWDWDFEIIDQMIRDKEAIVKGKLTVRVGDKIITKMQFGNKDIMYRKGTDEPLSIGNDLKAASTDCLKKCAAELGICADIYNKEDFKEVHVDTGQDWEMINQLFDSVAENMSEEDIIHAERIIQNKEKESYKKLLTLLKSKK